MWRGETDVARRGDGGSNSELLKQDVLDRVGRDSVLRCREPVWFV